jgi:hypothetical protein
MVCYCPPPPPISWTPTICVSATSSRLRAQFPEPYLRNQPALLAACNSAPGDPLAPICCLLSDAEPTGPIKLLFHVESKTRSYAIDFTAVTVLLNAMLKQCCLSSQNLAVCCHPRSPISNTQQYNINPITERVSPFKYILKYLTFRNKRVKYVDFSETLEH